MAQIKKIAKLLKKRKRVFIQTHNYPDHDAVSSAFALQQLLKRFKVEATIIYHGEILRDSLQRMIDGLGIEMIHHSSFEIDEDDAIVIVDANKGNRNVALLKGEVLVVVDHHVGDEHQEVPFSDIRSDYGACASIIFSYYAQVKVEPSKEVATALHAGVIFDTHQLSRNASHVDIDTFAMLYRVSDVPFVNALIKNSINLDDLPQYDYLLKNTKFHHNLAYCHFPNGCNRNLVAILSDYLLTIDEIDFVVLSNKVSDEITFSVRSKLTDLPAHIMIQEALSGIGSGGGHIDMAGGRIFKIDDFDEDTVFNNFLTQVRLRNSFEIKIADSLQ